MIAAPLAVTLEREKAVDLTTPYYDYATHSQYDEYEYARAEA